MKQKALNSLNPLLTIQDQIIDTIKAHETISHKDAINRCQYLIKLTRENNAWGRDIIESMYFLSKISKALNSSFLKKTFLLL